MNLIFRTPAYLPPSISTSVSLPFRLCLWQRWSLQNHVSVPVSLSTSILSLIFSHWPEASRPVPAQCPYANMPLPFLLPDLWSLNLSSPSLFKKSAFQISISTQAAYQKASAPFTSSNITWTTHICILEFSTFILARPSTIWLLLHRSFAKNTQNLRDKNSKCSAAKSRWKISVKMLAATF